MTVCACQLSMLSFERKGRVGMGITIKERRLVADLVVARRTVRSGGSRGKLTIVRILVAIRASIMRYGPPEVAFLVTAIAGKLGMLSGKLELRGVVIEV